MRTSLLIFCSLFCATINTEYAYNFVVWDVGQGSWATYVDETQCLHFDMGGEKRPPNKIIELCMNKENQLFLSHEDYDHFNFVTWSQRHFKTLCLVYPRKPRHRSIRRLPFCQTPSNKVRLIWDNENEKNKNGQSLVYLLLDTVVLPGDSLKKQERQWLKKIFEPVQLLILGHHGSETSSSKELLSKLKPVQVISSARQGRYGHPHWKVKQRLREQRIPLLSTDKWGSIFMKIPIGQSQF